MATFPMMCASFQPSQPSIQHCRTILRPTNDKFRTAPLHSEPPQQNERLERLGYSKQEIERSTAEDGKVKVNTEVVNVDAVTLTAIGFGLIAANFFIFANMGDGGLAGVVATIINTLKE